MGNISLGIESAIASPFFGMLLTLFSFWLGKHIGQRVKSPMANPFLIAIVLVIAFLQISGISPDDYQRGADVLSLMLIPATAILGVSIYHRRKLLRANALPILAGCFTGAVVSIVSTFYLCRWFGINEIFTTSLMPKSVTTPIAMELSQNLGGLVSLTVAAVVITGIAGAALAPWLIKTMKIENPIAIGVAFGAASHVVGTAKAIELGETEGATSGIAITGLITVGLFLLFL